MTPTVTSDGHTLFINENDNAVLVFFQARKQDENGLKADAVASIAVGGLPELEALQKTIADTIHQHKAREK